MKPIFIIGLVLLLLIVPVSADIKITAEPLGAEEVNFNSGTSVTYDASQEGLGIQRIAIDVPVGTMINYTIYYGGGSVVTGSAEYTQTLVDPITGSGIANSKILLGGNTSDFTYVGLLTNLVGRVYITGYAVEDDVTPGLVAYGSTGGLSLISNDWIFYPTDRNSDGVMYRVVITSNKNMDVAILTNPRVEVASVKNKGLLEVLNDWVNLALETSATYLSFLTTFYEVLKFFFWDNLVLTIALYIGLTGAMAFGTSKDIFSALKKFFNYQKKFYEFIIGLFNSLIDILNKIANIFK